MARLLLFLASRKRKARKTMDERRQVLTLLVGAAVLLVACGGGGDSEKSCEDLTGTWTGKISGTANTFYNDVPMVGDVVLKITPGDGAGLYTLTSMEVEAWSPDVPEAKVPLSVVGEHSFPCDELKIEVPIVAQGLPGTGALDGTCAGGRCTGSFRGKTDNDLMDAEGQFTITRR
jgi:hypothetical protein